MSMHPAHAGTVDPLPLWEAELRALVVEELTPERVGTLAAAALGASITTAAAMAVAQGGSVMMTTTVGASAAWSAAAKIAAGCVAATIAVGGTLAATGNLPDPAQEASADVAARIGITLPRPGFETGVRGSLGAEVGTIVTVANAGHVGVTLDGERLVLTGIQAEGAFTAHVVSQTDDAIVVEFRAANETTTVLLTNIGGKVASSVTTRAHASGEAGGSARSEAEAEVGGSADVESDDSSAEAEVEAEAEVGAGIEVRIGG